MSQEMYLYISFGGDHAMMIVDADKEEHIELHTWNKVSA